MLRVQEMATRRVDSFCCGVIRACACLRVYVCAVCVCEAGYGTVQHNEIIFSQHFVCVADEFLVYVRDLLMLYVCQHKILQERERKSGKGMGKQRNKMKTNFKINKSQNKIKMWQQTVIKMHCNK